MLSMADIAQIKRLGELHLKVSSSIRHSEWSLAAMALPLTDNMA